MEAPRAQGLVTLAALGVGANAEALPTPAATTCGPGRQVRQWGPAVSEGTQAARALRLIRGGEDGFLERRPRKRQGGDLLGGGTGRSKAGLSQSGLDARPPPPPAARRRRPAVPGVWHSQPATTPSGGPVRHRQGESHTRSCCFPSPERQAQPRGAPGSPRTMSTGPPPPGMRSCSPETLRAHPRPHSLLEQWGFAQVRGLPEVMCPSDGKAWSL